MLFLPEYDPILRERFAADGYLSLPALLSPGGLREVDGEVRRLEKLALRRDFTMTCMDDSPRHMTTLGGHVIAKESDMIPDLYHDETLLAWLSYTADFRTVPVDDLLERHVINILHQQGDTHGAHTDDYPLALVLFTEAPDHEQDGGLLEHTPHTTDLRALGTAAGQQHHHRPGDGYLLRSDTTAHRVTPLNRPGLRRTVLNFAYTNPQRQQATTPSASWLYCSAPDPDALREGGPSWGRAG
ncbi:HalD/BesD family halogenase [Streptomyces sp. NPDC002851]